MLLFVYTTTRKRFVIFTCRYFKLSWNTTALSQSNCRNLSCSSINLLTLLGLLQSKMTYFSTLSCTSTSEIPVPFHMLEAWKSYPFRAEPPRKGHYREKERTKKWKSESQRTHLTLVIIFKNKITVFTVGLILGCFFRSPLLSAV